ncbi:hypothetical protein MRX96_004644 [Rhipicephalus microplus]
MADGNNEPSHNSEALLSDLNEAVNHVDSTPQTCGPSPTVKAASLRLTRARPPTGSQRPPRSRLMRAFEALLEFFGDAALLARL